MLLNTLERLMLIDLLPERGNLFTLRIIADLKHELAFSEDEVTALGLQETDGGDLSWNPKSSTEKEVNIGLLATDVIQKRLRELNAQDALVPEHLSLCEKFHIT